MIAQIASPAAGCARPHAATAAANGSSYVYDANGNMTIRRELSGTETFVYTQTWSIDNRLIGVTKATVTGTVLAVTKYAYDGDGVRVRKDDPDGTTLYAGPVEQTIGPGGTATAEYFDDISGTSRLTAFVATRSEAVTAGLQQTFTVPPAGLGSEPYGVRYQIWLMVPTTDTYRLAVYADDGFILNGQGLTDTNTTTRGPTTTEAYRELTLLPNTIYNFGLTYLNYSAATTNTLQLLWRKGGGALEAVPVAAIHARGRRDYYSFGGAVVAMKEGVMSSATRTLTYLHGDHLGSASLTTNISGTVVSQQRYKPYGEVRWSSGAGMPTDLTFTGQRAGPAAYVGSLTDYVARFYFPALGRFVSADTIVPGAGNPQAYNRYMYVLGRVNNLVDPSGHCAESDQECIDTYNEVQKHLSFGALYLRRDWDTARLREFLGWMSRGVRITQASGSWSTTSLQALLDGLNRVQSTLGQRTDGLLGLSNGLMFVNDTGREKRVGNGWLVGETTTDRSGKRIVTLYNNPVSSGNDAEFTIVHEIGHVVHMGLGIDLKGTSELYQTWQRIHDQPGQPSRYAESNLFEDYAETFAWNAYYQTWSTWSLPLFRYQTPSSERREALMVSFDYLSCEIP